MSSRRRIGSRRQHGATTCRRSRSQKRRNFSSTKDKSEEECARSLSWMGQLLASSESSVAQEWAKTLSPQARAELIKIKRLSSLAEGHIPEPPARELRLVALSQAIPFVGFGFMDNAILIVAGDAIDTSLGVTLGISTMCAAAIGNIISDVAGILLGTIIEDFTMKLGLPVAQISANQRQLRSVRFAGQFGTCVGVVIGCVIGMFPLLLIDSNKAQKMKEEAHIDSIFRDVVTEAKDLIGAQSTRMFLVVDTPSATTPSSNREGNQYLYGRYAGKQDKVIRMSLGKGIVSRAVLTGEAVNVYDVHTEPDFSKDDETAEDIKNMLCVPVFDSQGHVIAVIQAINKVRKGIAASQGKNGEQSGGFTTGDVQVLKVLASHVSMALQVMFEEDAELTMRDTIKTLREHGLSGVEDPSTPTTRGRPLFPTS